MEQAGVKVDGDGFVKVDAQLRTSQPHIWAAGDVIGRQHRSQMATPVGARQGRIVAENAFAGAARHFDGSVIPRAIFTDPPIAAPEIIHEAAMARKRKASLADFIDLIHVYPTMSEALKIGAQAFSGDVTKLSCRAE